MGEGVNLAGKVAVVTGAGRGLGLGYARALAAAGAAVVVNDADADAAQQAAEAIRASGGSAASEAGPVGESELAGRLVQRAVDEYGRLDVMLTNAGILRDTVLWKMSDDDFDAVVRVHLRGTFTCVRAAARHMRERGGGGRIICIGSPTGQVGNFGQTNYAAAKAGIIGMVRTWALELQRAGITVNAMVPVAATAMTETVPLLAPYVESLRAGEAVAPYARRELSFGTIEEVAGLAVFLASDAAKDITGQVVGLGGDRLALWTHPAEAVVAFADGGWDAAAIADAWSAQLSAHAQPVGQHFPEP